MKRWYCLYTQPRMELWARANLWERGFEVYLPLYRKRRSHARRTDWVSAPLFPRYLFVAADLEAGERRRVAGSPGVAQFVAFGDRPAAVPPGIVAELRAREDASGHVVLRPDFRSGERVIVNEGPLLEQAGVFEARSGEERVLVLIELLGRQVRLRVPAHAVRRAD